jgi:YesN/AraC family two-component response regulator
VVCVSGNADNYEMLSECRIQAYEMFKYRFRYNQNGLLFFEDMDESPVVHPLFPQYLEDNILHSLRQGDRAETNAALEKFIRYVLEKENLKRQWYLTLSRLMVDILRIAQEYDTKQSNFISQEEAFERIFTFRNWRQIYNWFKEKCTDPLLNIIKQRISVKERVLIDKMKKIAETQYEDYISVEIIAKSLESYPGYLRSIFKEGTGMAFSAYLTICRMEAAKSLLKNANIRIADVAEKLTYQNSQNFIRAFKTHVGMTPGEYRKINETKYFEYE